LSFWSESFESFPFMASKFFINTLLRICDIIIIIIIIIIISPLSSHSPPTHHHQHYHLPFIFILYYLHSSPLPWFFFCSLFSSLTFRVLFPPPLKLIYFCPSFYSWFFILFFHLPFYLSAVVLQAQKDKPTVQPITAFFRSFWICHSSNKCLPTFRTHST
jgi:magnesium-transporting ATPase (P-type)